jgi:hypothetical protein
MVSALQLSSQKLTQKSHKLTKSSQKLSQKAKNQLDEVSDREEEGKVA